MPGPKAFPATCEPGATRGCFRICQPFTRTVAVSFHAKLMSRIVPVLFALLIVPAFALADECCDCKCDHCGCEAQCHKVTRVICEMKDVKVTCYCCREEEIAIPGHSKKCGEVCEPNPCCTSPRPVECEGCACNDCEHKHSWLDCLCGADKCDKRICWEPKCSGKTRMVNHLIKYEVTKKVPTYKYVVENCCDQCSNCTSVETAVPPKQLDQPVPAKPAQGSVKTTSTGTTRAVIITSPRAPADMDELATAQVTDQASPIFLPHAELPPMATRESQLLENAPWDRLQK
jgi:hypothetical protein